MTYRDNILQVADHATPDEIADGLSFYHEWNGLSKMLCKLFSLESLEHGAGILASLSPMNNNATDNIADAFAVCRYGDKASVRTTNINKRKAYRIRCGEHPTEVISGRKGHCILQWNRPPGAGRYDPS